MAARKKQTPPAGDAPATGRKRTNKAQEATSQAVEPANGKTVRRRKTVVSPSEAEPQAQATSRAADASKPDLVIVESPTKAKTINKYLGPGFKVVASYGHVRDLPRSGKQKGEEIAGVNIGNGWILRYVVLDKADDKSGRGTKRRSQKEVLEELRREAAKANRIYLASDPDREGEAIAWHIADELKLDPDRTFRIRFNEITKSAVQQALQNASKIDLTRVKAQEARRALDRVVGYPLSDLLRIKVSKGLSAGRVQSVALRLIVDREREIEAFRSEEYWKITAMLAPQGAVRGYVADLSKSKIYAKKKGAAADSEAESAKEVPQDPETAPESTESVTPPVAETVGMPKLPPQAFFAELVRWQNQEFAASNETQVDAVLNALRNATYVVSKIEQKDRPEKAPPPFTTSTLQQQANIRLRFPSSKTMQLAQRLYEGVDLGPDGSVALITYMRTDSTHVSTQALQMVRAHIQSTYGPAYLPTQPNQFVSGKSAQEAHEAIRPTDLTYTPQRVAPYLKQDELRLYTLIYNRFVASQMTPAVFAVTNVEVTAGAGLFKAQGRIEKFDGYRRVLPPASKSQETTLPPLQEKQVLDQLDLLGSQHFTQPPPRFNEASLVRTLEKEGIGRPSTYASIISTIKDRGYVELKHNRFYATEIGKVVTDLLVQHFPKVMDLKFTSQMEEELDQIETGQTQYNQVLDGFWKPFSDTLALAKEAMPQQKAVETGEMCPKCGRPLLEMFSSKLRRKFVGCSGYRDKQNPCRYIKPREGEAERPEAEWTDVPCPSCGKMMMKRFSPKNQSFFLGCSGYPECTETIELDADGKPKPKAVSAHNCDKCGKPMVIRQGRRGPFLACTGYPKCKNALDVDAQGNPVRPVDTGEFCEKCNAPMVIKKGPRGPFLSCSGYPKCRNAKPLSPELKEKLKDQLAVVAPKREVPNVEVKETCPLCGSSMKIRSGVKGPFLGCSKYPKCKGTREATPELLQALQTAEA